MNEDETLRKLERIKNDLNTIFDDSNLTTDEVTELYNTFSSVTTMIAQIRNRNQPFNPVSPIDRHVTTKTEESPK